MPVLPVTTAVAKAEMLIREPVGRVFDAFIDPRVTANFWFTQGSGPLEAGKQVTWRWDMWRFTDQSDGTYVSVTNEGFTGDPESRIDQVRAATEGFALVLAGAKAFLEHGLRLNLVADRHPDGLRR